MGEYIGKINLPKDTMLFVVNEIFDKNIKESTTKENILKMIPEIYTEENFPKILKMLSYEGYIALEKLLEFTKKSDDIKAFEKSIDYKGVRALEEAMILIVRARYSEYLYSLNPNVIEKLTPLFNSKNREIAERYGKIEKLVEGILYTYGVVEFDFFKKIMSKCMGEVISEDELMDLFTVRLNLNSFVSMFGIKWNNTDKEQFFITYLNEEVVGYDYIVSEQKSRGLNYKMFDKKGFLNREEYLWDKNAQNLYEFIRKNNDRLFEFQFKRILKENEIGYNIMDTLSELCRFNTEEEMFKFSELFMKWHNNSPQYVLGGYTPNELSREFYKNPTC